MINIHKFGVDFVVTPSIPSLDDFWKNIYQTEWETETFTSILPFLDINKTFIDIGAWQGPISLVAQKYSKQCICFEPDPKAFENLLKNVQLNNFNNIVVVNKAVSSEQSLKLGHPYELGGGGSSYHIEDNELFSKLRTSGDDLTVECDTISIADILKNYKLNPGDISLIKIDIEGYECELLKDQTLKDLKDFGIPMHISMHPFMFSDRTKYFEKMADFFGLHNFIDYSTDTYEIFINN
jgi:FkbM family methyltransferase